MSELKFVVELAKDSFVATALGESIFTQARSREQLLHNVRDAVRAHFKNSPLAPKRIHLHYTGDESIALVEGETFDEFPARNTVLKYDDPYEPACPPEEWEANR